MYRSIACSLATLPLLAVPAMAQPLNGSIGVSVTLAPDYLGSDDYKTRILPDANLRYGDQFYLNLRDGLGWNLYHQKNWTLSPFIGYIPGRDNDGDLSRFEKIDGGITGGMRLRYQPGPWNVTLKAQTPLTGDMDGYQVILRAGWRHSISPNWSAGIGPNLIYSSKEWTQSLFRVSATDAARSGFQRYEPGDGYWRLGLSGHVNYRFSSNWSLTGLATVTRLTGDAKDSPIVRQVGESTQVLAGTVLSYHF
ncbi:MipA/OmpV family protein [Oceanimonas baumannii]|uniref:Outer membrane protein n=1 Tax=Oceanimonas baumannii TaxID=129578 RepID=A0A235CFC7_9GAMM|nr:MipA/OmpV family protein [Oceanimonas baumannii]OYD23328.1 structural protein MipA [Oceanimonas baumannii]TDW58524.1 outer membrane protein [Oceanimonas baumannii]